MFKFTKDTVFKNLPKVSHNDYAYTGVSGGNTTNKISCQSWAHTDKPITIRPLTPRDGNAYPKVVLDLFYKFVLGLDKELSATKKRPTKDNQYTLTINGKHKLVNYGAVTLYRYLWTWPQGVYIAAYLTKQGFSTVEIIPVLAWWMSYLYHNNSSKQVRGHGNHILAFTYPMDCPKVIPALKNLRDSDSSTIHNLTVKQQLHMRITCKEEWDAYQKQNTRATYNALIRASDKARKEFTKKYSLAHVKPLTEKSTLCKASLKRWLKQFGND